MEEITGDNKKLLGEEYYDYGLVVTLSDVKTCERKIIEKSFNRLKKRAELSNVKFHYLRHSSITYKLKIDKDDIKATQGDSVSLDILKVCFIQLRFLNKYNLAMKFKITQLILRY